jgi:hypothetical protein
MRTKRSPLPIRTSASSFEFSEDVLASCSECCDPTVASVNQVEVSIFSNPDLDGVVVNCGVEHVKPEGIDSEIVESTGNLSLCKADS